MGVAKSSAHIEIGTSLGPWASNLNGWLGLINLSRVQATHAFIETIHFFGFHLGKHPKIIHICWFPTVIMGEASAVVHAIQLSTKVHVMSTWMRSIIFRRAELRLMWWKLVILITLIRILITIVDKN